MTVQEQVAILFRDGYITAAHMLENAYGRPNNIADDCSAIRDIRQIVADYLHQHPVEVVEGTAGGYVQYFPGDGFTVTYRLYYSDGSFYEESSILKDALDWLLVACHK